MGLTTLNSSEAPSLYNSTLFSQSCYGNTLWLNSPKEARVKELTLTNLAGPINN